MNVRYITLMSSLPYLGKLFEVKQPPILQMKLESRLKLLKEKDKALLDKITKLPVEVL